MARFVWQNGSKVESAKVTVEGQVYEVQDAQYEGETPLTAGNLNAMEDDIYNNIDKINNQLNLDNKYSTSEIKTSKVWINNKPIYRKCFTATSISTTVSTGITNLETMVNMKMLIKDSSANGQWRPIPWCYKELNSEWFGGFFYQSSDSTIRIQLGSELGKISAIVVIIEYTKTNN